AGGPCLPPPLAPPPPRFRFLSCARPAPPATHFEVRFRRGTQKNRRARFPAVETCLGWLLNSSRELAQHVLQDAAVLEVFQLVERIDARDQRNALQTAVGRDDLGDQSLARLELAMQAADRHLPRAFEPGRLPADAPLEGEWDDANADQVRTVDALERLADHRADAEQHRSLGGPVA